MKKILRYLRSSLGYLYVCFKWVILAALVGCVVGPFGAMFGLALNKATALRTADPRLIYLLPLGGLVIVFLYQHFDPDGGGSTNQIFVAVREHKPLSLRTAPLIFVATVITHLFGGSSGRDRQETAAGGPGLPPDDHVRHGGGVFRCIWYAAGRYRIYAGSRRRRLHAVRSAAALPDLGADRRVDQQRYGAGPHRLCGGRLCRPYAG